MDEGEGVRRQGMVEGERRAWRKGEGSTRHGGRRVCRRGRRRREGMNQKQETEGKARYKKEGKRGKEEVEGRKEEGENVPPNNFFSGCTCS